MKTTFSYNPELEYERFVNIYRSLVSNLYQDHGFLVLPYRLNDNPKSVYLPDVKNLQLETYAADLRQMKVADIPLRYPSSTIQKMIGELKKKVALESIDKDHVTSVEEAWRIVEAQFEDYLVELFPRYRRYHFELNVYWTRYGTLVSFGRAELQGMSATINIHLRDDMGVAQIVEGFISSLFLSEMIDEMKYVWLQREAIVDFILQKTKIARLFTGFIPTLDTATQAKNLEKYYKESAVYVAQLGFAHNMGLAIEDKEVLVNGQHPRYRFTKNEMSVLERLVRTPDEPVSYFELGDILWKDKPDDFSLWALSRIMYKLRNKLRQNGLSENYVKNVRGEGYLYTRLP